MKGRNGKGGREARKGVEGRGKWRKPRTSGSCEEEDDDDAYDDDSFDAYDDGGANDNEGNESMTECEKRRYGETWSDTRHNVLRNTL